MYDNYITILIICCIAGLVSIVSMIISVYLGKEKIFDIFGIICVITFVLILINAIFLENIQSNAMDDLQDKTKITVVTKVQNGKLFDYEIHEYDGFKLKYKVIDSIIVISFD